MKQVYIVVAVALEHVAAIVDALSATGVADSVTIRTTDDANVIGSPVQPSPTRRGSVATGATVADSAEPVTRTKRVSDGSSRGSGQSRSVLMPAPRMTMARLRTLIDGGKLALPPQAQLVAKIVLAHPKGISNADLTTKSKINFHSVDGAVFRLRKSDPAIIVSVPVEGK